MSFADPLPRALLVGPSADIDSLLAAHGSSAASWNDWRLAQIAAGEPQVHLQTSEHFVAQMLNLDLIGGVSFTKGCYTGQEIIVRTQHLGRIKRRMVRLSTIGQCPAVGDKVMRGAEAIGAVVQAATLPDGQCELLAVVSLARLAGPTADLGAAGLQRLPLPYPTDEELAAGPSVT